MKVLQIINSLKTGGAEKLLVATIPNYVKKGVKMDLLLLNGEKTPFIKTLKSKQCCTIYNLGLGSVYNPLLVFKIMSYLKKYDIVHVHLFPAQYWVVFAKLLSFSKVKLVFTEHNTTNKRLENKFFKFIDRYIYKFYTKIICISEEIFKIIQHHSRLKKDRLVIIENGIDLKVLKEAHKLKPENLVPNYSKKDKLIIQIAGFRPQKDQLTVIKSLQYLPKNVKLILVGDGILINNCKELVNELNLKFRVVFLGLRSDIPQLLKSSDIVVLSSKYEGLSLSSIEGMASGKPFIASRVPGLQEVVKGAGVLFELGNSKELANSIENLISDKDYYNSIVKSCLKRAKNYDISVMINKHIELYKSLANET